MWWERWKGRGLGWGGGEGERGLGFYMETLVGSRPLTRRLPDQETCARLQAMYNFEEVTSSSVKWL